MTFVGTVNKECEQFKILSIVYEQLKCLIFVCQLRSARYRDIRTKILSKIGQNPDVTLQQAADECLRLVILKHDSDMVQQSVPPPTSTLNTIQGQQYSTLPCSTQKKPPSACWNCAGLHFARKYPFKTHYRRECNQQEHKEGFCTPLVHKTTNKRPHNKRRNVKNTIW